MRPNKNLSWESLLPCSFMPLQMFLHVGQSTELEAEVQTSKIHSVQFSTSSPSPRGAQAGYGNSSVVPRPQVHRMHKRNVL